MTKNDAIFEMTLRLTYGRVLKFYINSETTIEELRQLKNELAQDCRKICDAPVQATKDKRPAQERASLASKCRETDAPPVVVLNGQVSAPETSGRKKIPAEDLDEAHSALADKSSEMAELDAQLAPVWRAERDIKDNILGTHNLDRRGVISFRPMGRTDRKPLFRELDAIAKEWGPVKAKRSRLNSEIRTLEREITSIKKSMTKQKRRA